MRTLVRLTVVAGIAAAALLAQGPGGFVDYYIAKVKPEKRSDFEAIGRKVADANRKYKGDTFLAYSVEYGEEFTYLFGSVRENLAAIDQGTTSFMNALKEGFGPNVMKLMQDMNNCTISSRGELRRRRPDLSRNMPGDQAALSKYVGESKWIRYVTIRVRPGHIAAFEESLKDLNAAYAKGADKRPILASQSAAGSAIGTYYLVGFYKSMGDMETMVRPVREVIGEEAFARYQKSQETDTFGAEYTIARIVPELSNPTPEIASAAPDFWNPKPAAAPKPKPKPATPGL
jgi:quinol monooxygenase YgiN